jgi:hypothetical protein
LSLLDHPIDIIVAEARRDHETARLVPGPGQPVVRFYHDGDHAVIRHAEALQHIGDLSRRGFEDLNLFVSHHRLPALI